jgi:hypothetical protein
MMIETGVFSMHRSPRGSGSVLVWQTYAEPMHGSLYAWVRQLDSKKAIADL